MSAVNTGIFPIYVSENVLSQQVWQDAGRLAAINTAINPLFKLICTTRNQQFNILLLQGLFLLKQLGFGASSI